MCGINGIVYFDRRSFDPGCLRMMCAEMTHRGPDDEGYFYKEGVGLGFRRLSIIDTEGAHQPIANEDETIWMICNGEIYNYKSLRETLTQKGHRFRTAGDTETILHLYEEYGEDCVHHLRGMFAFIIWDEHRQVFFAARDYFGIKPLYYRLDGEKLICSSELKSLLAASDQRPELDTQSLLYYLAYQYVPDPRTMLAGISKLPPAHSIRVQNGKCQIQRYWSPRFEPVDRPVEAIRREIRDVLQESVRLHMQSDVPRGCFLSSGVDSTAIAAMMRKIEPIKTFSVGFEGRNNELGYASETAKALGTEHHEWLIGEDDYFDAVRSCIWYQDDPVADPSAIALYLVAKMASQYVTVVLSGEGADELFGGYRIYQEPLALKALQWLPPAFRQTLNRMLRSAPDFYGKNYLIRATTPLEERFLGNAKIFTDDARQVFIEQSPGQFEEMATPFQWAKQYYEQAKEWDDITRMQYIDLNLWLPGDILVKADKMTMAHSLELRVPFLDREVFKVAGSIPASYRVDKTTTKRILREALEEIVPPHIINRPKLGFPVPLRDWLRGERGKVCLDTIRSSGIGTYINESYIAELVAQHKTGKADHARRIWAIYVLAEWFTQIRERYRAPVLSGTVQR